MNRRHSSPSMLQAAVSASALHVHVGSTPRTAALCPSDQRLSCETAEQGCQAARAVSAAGHMGASTSGGLAPDQIAVYAAMPPSKLAQLETLLAELTPLVQAARAAQDHGMEHGPHKAWGL